MSTMTINPAIFKSYDIRGIYPTDLNEESIVPIIRAIFAFFKKSADSNKPLTIVVGTDMRTSSPSLTNKAIETLVALGAQIIDVGVLSTPTFYFAVSHYGYEAGVQITASHNPKEWNGVKIVRKGEKGLIKIGKPTGMEEIKKMAIDGTCLPTPGNGTVVEKPGVVDDEVENALSLFGHPKVSKCKIVADPANAMGASYIEAFFKKIPAELIKMNFELDGTFPAHQPDPLQFDTLKDLQARVLSENADFGLAPDGDGDRLFFIDEKGQIIPGTMITALVAREFLQKFPGCTILFDVRNILTPKKIVEENGGKFVITKVGHAYITEALTNTGGIFAGEGSGHFYYQASGNAESQVITILCVLMVLTEEKKKLSEVIQELKRSFESGEINFNVSNGSEIMQKVKEKYTNGILNNMDGIAIDYPQWRFSLRASNTEPLLRLNVEALDEETMIKKSNVLQGLIKSLAK